MNRRTFLKSTLAAGVTSATAYRLAMAEEAARSASQAVPRRKYRDDIELSVVGFGGIIVNGLEQVDADREVAWAIDRGVNYFDVAPSYGHGESERKLGPALEPFRSKAFLACKTTERDAAGAQKEMDESLKTLRTDHFDLYQLHAVTKMEDVAQILGPGGALEVFQKAKEAGKVRYIGFSAHSEEAALALLDAFAFDSVLFPVNFVCYAEGNFGPTVIAKAKERGAARLALKSMAYTAFEKGQQKKWAKTWYNPVDDLELVRKAVRFTLTEDVTALIPPGHSELFRMAVDIASAFEPLAPKERAELLASAAGLKPLFRVS